MSMPQTTLRPFPTRQALSLLAVGVALYVVLGWLLLTANRNSRLFRDDLLVLGDDIADARLQVGQLHALALLAASTGEQVFLVRHRERRDALVADLAKLAAIAKNVPEIFQTTGLQIAIGPFLAAQDKALALVERQESATAWSLLRSLDYDARREILELCLDACDAAVAATADAVLASQNRYTLAAIWCLVLITPVLVAAGLVHVRKARDTALANIAAQKALAESELRFRSTFEQAAVGMAHVGLDGRFLRINDRFCTITGHTREELSRLTFAAITHPDDLGRDQERVGLLLGGAVSTYVVDKRYLRRDGSTVWANLTVSLIRDEAGRPAYCLAVIKDISERKAAEDEARESARTISALLDATTDRVILADGDGRILAVNAAAAGGLGLAGDEVLGKRFAEVFPGAVAALRLERLRESMATGRSVRFSDEHDGIVFDNIISPLPDAEGVPRGAALFARDATDLIRAREAAEAASKAKSEFLATLSHEIRTPLNGILGMTQVLAGSQLAGEQRLCLEDIDSSARALLDLVNALLEFSEIEAGRLELVREPFVLGSILQSVQGALDDRAREKGLDFVVETGGGVPELLLGDGDRLRQVLLNLTDNAVKFTAEGSVRLAVDALASESDAVSVALRFSIEDTGIGIAESDQVRIFESFIQADGSATRRFGGTGLGLAIAKRLVERMGGTISLSSAPGRGSVFSFTIRFDLPEALPESNGV